MFTEISKETLAEIMVNSTRNRDRKIRCAIMINYIPVCQLSAKPLYLIALYHQKVLELGYATSRTFTEIDLRVRLAELNRMIFDSTIVQEAGLSSEEIPETLKPFKDKRGLDSIRILHNTSAYGPFTINFITTDYKPYLDLMSNFKELSDRNNYTSSKLAVYAIMQQSKLDSFPYFITKLTDSAMAMSKLNNSVITSTNINRQSVVQMMAASFSIDRRDSILNKVINIPGVGDTQIVVLVDGGEVNDTELDVETMSAVAVKEPMTFYMAGLQLLQEDFSVGGATGLKQYIQTNNPLMEAWLVNSSLYDFAVWRSDYTLYNMKFEEIYALKGDPVYEVAVDGKITFQQMLANVVR